MNSTIEKKVALPIPETIEIMDDTPSPEASTSSQSPNSPITPICVATSQPPQPPLYTLITCPRTCSNLAVKILNLENQPTVKTPATAGGYYFFPVLVQANLTDVRGKHVSEWTEAERVHMATCYQSCFESFLKYYTDAQEENKVAFAKEHANFFFGPTSIAEIVNPGIVAEDEKWLMKFPDGRTGTRSALNETVMPDEFLNLMNPVFLIRHPALAFPSFEREMRKMPTAIVKSIEVERRIAMTHKFTRSLFAYFTNRFEKGPFDDGVNWPLIIDADDMMQNPEFFKKVGGLMGMDTEKMQFTWEKAPEEKLDRMPLPMRNMTKSLNTSSGVKLDKLSKNIDIDVEAKKWKEEFGEEDGGAIEQLVRDAMPDYEWLKSRRMMPTFQKQNEKPSEEDSK